VIVETRPGNRGNEGDLDPKMMEKVRAGAKKAAELAARGKIAVPKLPAKFVMTVPMKTNGAAELAPKLLRYPVKVEGRNVTRESTDFMEIYSFLHAAFWVQSESDRQEKAKQGN
jgi:D-aminopeptidase